VCSLYTRVGLLVSASVLAPRAPPVPVTGTGTGTGAPGPVPVPVRGAGTGAGTGAGAGAGTSVVPSSQSGLRISTLRAG